MDEEEVIKKGRPFSENPEELAKKRVVTYLTNVEDDELKALVKKKGSNKSAIIRQAIRGYIESNR